MEKWRDKLTEVERKRVIPLAKQTLRSNEGKDVLTYLKNERGFSDKVIDSFDIGFCPLWADHQLRGRIITPVYDAYNQLVVLSTRHIDKNAKRRFWHETFNKRTHLFALNHAKEYMISTKKVILVEGEFDVCAYHSANLPMTVGVMGSAFNLFQLSLLLKYCSEIYLMFDGDEAGEKAIKKAMKLFKKYNLKDFGINLIPVYLPTGIDPDDFLFKEGREGVIKKLKKSKEESEFLV